MDDTAVSRLVIDLDALVLEPTPSSFASGALDDRASECPACSEPLVRMWTATTPVSMCRAYGLWIAGPNRDAFSNDLVLPLERRSRIVSMREQLAAMIAGKPGAIEAVAAKLIDLEDQIAKLTRRR